MFQAICAGRIALCQLAQDQTLTVLGKTSRGIFLQTSAAWTIFLTEETHRGPITINLPPGSIDPIRQAASQNVRFRQNTLIFSSQVQLALDPSAGWQAPPPSFPPLPLASRHKTISQVIQYILERKSVEGLTGILPDLLPLLSPESPSVTASGPFTSKLFPLITALRACQTESLPDLLSAFIGQGGGLTPSGDDFLLGYFLAHHRWGERLQPAEPFPPFARQIMLEARHKTTLLSANLLECAMMGQADQRLILALDGLLTAGSCEPVWCDGFLDWGNSSGCDALAGMLLAIDPHLIL
jgi:hypothetical protein